MNIDDTIEKIKTEWRGKTISSNEQFVEELERTLRSFAEKVREETTREMQQYSPTWSKLDTGMMVDLEVAELQRLRAFENEYTKGQEQGVKEETERLKQIVQKEIAKADKHEIAPLQRIMVELLTNQ